jgi:hypothetical protein
VRYRTLDVPERFDCHVALLSTDYFSATDATVNIGVKDRRFFVMRMVYHAACKAKASTLSVITPASPR